ncbi:MAG: hypothetical protein B7X06_00700 [Verrucomicrobia bacterium 21-51-4]|nr:MAG: hypothetical protein B7X06_00700 [Verrucomicrobia bacterium 21-51-4]HQU08353.1 HAD-IIIA family hydrolase [Opitutales bacterium]
MTGGLFLDRDGTIIKHVPYLSDPAQVKLCPGAREALERALQLGFKLFLFTNQSGIGRGMYTLEDAQACNAQMLKLLNLGPDVFTDTCIAPEAPHEPVNYRKPSPKYILEQIKIHNLATHNSYMIGDSIKDIEAGQAAGIHVIGIDNPQLPEAEHIQGRAQSEIKICKSLLEAIMGIDG